MFHWLEWEKTVKILDSLLLLVRIIFHLQLLERILLSTHSSWCLSYISLACVQLACRDALWLWLSSVKLHSSWWAANSMWHERENSFHILLLITKWNVTQIIGAAQINDLDSILTLQSICTICDPTSVLLVESLLWQSKEKVFKSYLLLEPVGNVLLLIKFHQTQGAVKWKRKAVWIMSALTIILNIKTYTVGYILDLNCLFESVLV